MQYGTYFRNRRNQVAFQQQKSEGTRALYLLQLFLALQIKYCIVAKNTILVQASAKSLAIFLDSVSMLAKEGTSIKLYAR